MFERMGEKADGLNCWGLLDCGSRLRCATCLLVAASCVRHSVQQLPEGLQGSEGSPASLSPASPAEISFCFVLFCFLSIGSVTRLHAVGDVTLRRQECQKGDGYL